MVDELPERQAEVIRARYQRGETLQQVGDSLAMTFELSERIALGL